MSKLLVQIALLLLPTFGLAQFNSQGAFPYLDIRPFMSFKVEVIGDDLEYKFQQASEYSSGITKESVFRVSVKSNKNWRVFVSSTAPFFTPLTPNSSSNIPVGVLRLRKASEINFKQLQVTYVELSSGNRGGWGKPGNMFFVDLRADPGANYSGGSYVCDVAFTITAD